MSVFTGKELEYLAEQRLGRIATVGPDGGKAFGERFEDTIVRIPPTRIVSIGIESGEMTTSARSAGAT